jgi:MoxR-like ATPase
MTWRVFTGRGDRRASSNGSRAARIGVQDIDPASYVTDPALVDAVNVALLLDQPLLVAGEPGTGKTQLAYRIAWELERELLKFETKSTSQARELFYTYDALGRYQAGGPGAGAVDPLPFLQFGALGRAALLASDDPPTRSLLGPTEASKPSRRSVVLIDEIDKAPRDFPNDMLNEIEHFYFKIPELQNRSVEAPRDRRPFVVITSNSEKDLPDAFLRRCVFHHIEFPDEKRLEEIVVGRMGTSMASTPFLRKAVGLFQAIRDGKLRKKPATAELLGWILAMRHAAPDTEDPLADPAVVTQTLSAIVKTVEDREEAAQIVKAWQTRPR